MIRPLFLALLFVAAGSFASAQTSGAFDHALGGSSVMWLPRTGALFLNPAELGQIRQGSFAFNARRLSTLSSFSGAYFVPFVGTFAAGFAAYGPINQYSFGYGIAWGDIMFGTGFSGFRNAEESFGFSLGGSWHMTGQVTNSGSHIGFSVINVSDKTASPFFSVNVGAGYWVSQDLLRVQTAFRRTGVISEGLAGIEVLAAQGFGLQVGTRAFKEIVGGFRYQETYGSLELSAGKSGLVVSINTSLSEPAAEARDRNNGLGLQALNESRYSDAQRYFALAHQFDPLFASAKAAADSAGTALVSERELLEAKAEIHYGDKDYIEASRLYARILQIDPENEVAREKFREMQLQLKSYFDQLIVTGDSLRARREIDRARRNYQQALDLDPGNDSITARIVGLRDLAQENIRLMLNRATAYFDRNQLGEAEREYERVLAAEPRNTRARLGIAAIKTKRTDELLDRGKNLSTSNNHLEALRIFLQVAENIPQHREASELIDQTRQILKPEVETFFRLGLQLYTKEDYKGAIEEWDKGLLIDPNHQGTVEYRKRADE
ncbi:MAG: tetratricopeptide repeat protein, partial [Bacteroidota bacterium]